MTMPVTAADTRFELAPVRQLTAAERRPLNRPTIRIAATIEPDDAQSSAERKAALADQVAVLVASGRRLEYQGPFDAVLLRGRAPGHGLDRLPKFLTGVVGGEQRELVVVDKSGNVTVTDE